MFLFLGKTSLIQLLYKIKTLVSTKADKSDLITTEYSFTIEDE